VCTEIRVLHGSTACTVCIIVQCAAQRHNLTLHSLSGRKPLFRNNLLGWNMCEAINFSSLIVGTRQTRYRVFLLCMVWFQRGMSEIYLTALTTFNMHRCYSSVNDFHHRNPRTWSLQRRWIPCQFFTILQNSSLIMNTKITSTRRAWRDASYHVSVSLRVRISLKNLSWARISRHHVKDKSLCNRGRKFEHRQEQRPKGEC
jgi:hypothetical protein